MQLVEKYRPKTFAEIQGHTKSIRQIKKWIENFEPGDKPMLLHGPQGTGKTTTARVAARHIGAPIEEINASSTRSSDDLKRIAASVRSRTMDGGYKVVLIDEFDSIPYRANTRDIVAALDDPENPVFITCNEVWNVPDSIRNKCKEHKFKLGKKSKKAYIRKVAELEDIDISNRLIGKLSTRDDLRSALNDLEAYAGQDEIPWDQRSMDMGEFKAVENVLRGKKWIGDDISPNDFVLWLDENVSSEFAGVEAAAAYDALSLADMWLGRAFETGDYGYWRYAGELSEHVARLRVTEPYDGWIPISFPEHFRSRKESWDRDTPEANLYRQLKDTDHGSFRFSGGFYEFRRQILPLLLLEDEETRMRLVNEMGLDKSAVKALNLDIDNVESWRTTYGEADEEKRQRSREKQTSLDSL